MAIVRVIAMRVKVPRKVTVVVNRPVHRDGWFNHDTRRCRRLCNASRRTLMRERERGQHHEGGGEPPEP